MLVMNLLRILMLPIAGMIGLGIVAICEKHDNKVLEVLANDEDRMY